MKKLNFRRTKKGSFCFEDLLLLKKRKVYLLTIEIKILMSLQYLNLLDFYF